MNITCIICSEEFLPHSEVYTTQCGHLFHYHCLIQWINRSKTCPQCRARATEKTIYRIFFTLENSDQISDEVVFLQNNLDNLQTQMSQKEEDVKSLTEKYNKSEKETALLRAQVAEVENQVHTLKDQIVYFKKKAKESDRLGEELQQTKNQLKEMQMLNTAVTGTREEVDEILKNESNVESLGILSATLKKALVDAEEKKHHAEHKLKHLQSEVSKYRRDVSSLETSNDELREELQTCKQSWEQEKEHLTKAVENLTKAVKNLNKKGAQGNTTIIKRILEESPVPLTLQYSDGDSEEIINLDDTTLPSLDEKVIELSDTESPLPGKSNGFSVFGHIKHSTLVKENGKPRNSVEIVCDGVFPMPIVGAVGMKRHKTTSRRNVSKSRKLNPSSYKIK